MNLALAEGTAARLPTLEDVELVRSLTYELVQFLNVAVVEATSGS